MAGLLGDSFNYVDPGVGLAAGLLSGRGNLGANLALGLGGGQQAAQANRQFALTQQAAERANRQNDLQQLMGLYGILKNQDAMQAYFDGKAGRPHVPVPGLSEIEQKMGGLLGMPPLSSGAASGSPPSLGAGGLTAPTPASPMQPPQLGAQPSAPIPAPQGQGVPMQPPMSQAGRAIQDQLDMADMQAFLAGKPDLVAQNLYQRAKPISTRYGIYVPNPNDPAQALLAGGMMPQNALPIQPGPNGGSVQLLPGQLASAAALSGANAAAKALGALPYEPPTVIQTQGAPTLMTRAQQIQAATGQNPLAPPTQIPPAVQTQRNDGQIKILQNELAQATNPQDRAAINTQLAALRNAQSSGQPFSASNPPGLPLQDQIETATQSKLGDLLGSQMGDVFKQGASSVRAKAQLSIMANLANDFTPSKFQPLKSQFGQYLIAAGVPESTVNKTLGTNVGSIQALTSSAISIAGKLTRESDAQPSQLQFMKTLESMPMADRTADGFKKIMDYLNSMHDYNIQKMAAATEWLQTHKDPNAAGFETAWSQQAKAMPFVWNQQPAQSAGAVRRYNPQTGRIE